LTIIDGWVAADDLARIDIARDAALSSGDGSVSYGAMAGNANLASEDDGFADGGRSGEADLSAKEGILADSGTVAYLNEVVDFGPGVNAGFADGGAVDTGVGLDFNCVLKDGGARLKNLVPGAIGLACEAEPVSADDGAVLKDDIVSELAVFANYRMGVGKKIVSGGDMGVKDDMREKNGIVAQGDIVGKNNIGADVGVGSDFGGGGDYCSGVNARGVDRGLIEELDGPGES